MKKLFNEHKTAIILISLIIILSLLSSLKNDNLNEYSKEKISNTNNKPVKSNRPEKFVDYYKNKKTSDSRGSKTRTPQIKTNTSPSPKIVPRSGNKSSKSNGSSTRRNNGGEKKVTGVTSGTLATKKTRKNYTLKRSSLQLDIDWPKDSKKSKHLFYKVSVNNKYVTSLSDYSFNESFKAYVGDVVRIDRKTQRSFKSYKFCTSFVISENKYQYQITCK